MSKLIFDTVRPWLDGEGFTPARIAALDRAIAGTPPSSPKPRAMIDPAAFFVAVRAITGPLDHVQVDTLNRLTAAAAHWPVGWLAYGLATAWHEARLKPIAEWGLGKGRPYAKPAARMEPMKNAPTYGGQIPYGRGLVQLTWSENYEWADKALGLNGALLANFDKALEPAIATRILVKGMEEGAFTGKALRDYLRGDVGTHDGFVPARRIINGNDKSEMIAGLAERFQKAAMAGGWS